MWKLKKFTLFQNGVKFCFYLDFMIERFLKVKFALNSANAIEAKKD